MKRPLLKAAPSSSKAGAAATEDKDATLFQELRKTKMCSFHAKGHCRYGVNCAFAHFPHELHIAPDLRKTSLCKAFEAGKCSTRDCKFAHGEKELRGHSEQSIRPPGRLTGANHEPGLSEQDIMVHQAWMAFRHQELAARARHSAGLIGTDFSNGILRLPPHMLARDDFSGRGNDLDEFCRELAVLYSQDLSSRRAGPIGPLGHSGRVPTQSQKKNDLGTSAMRSKATSAAVKANGPKQPSSLSNKSAMEPMKIKMIEPCTSEVSKVIATTSYDCGFQTDLATLREIYAMTLAESSIPFSPSQIPLPEALPPWQGCSRAWQASDPD